MAVTGVASTGVAGVFGVSASQKPPMAKAFPVGVGERGVAGPEVMTAQFSLVVDSARFRASKDMLFAERSGDSTGGGFGTSAVWDLLKVFVARGISSVAMSLSGRRLFGRNCGLLAGGASTFAVSADLSFAAFSFVTGTCSVDMNMLFLERS
jgi:hypothetical protein